MKEDIIQLQETIAHQSEDITRLSDELYTQQREINELRNEITKLHARLKGVLEGSSNIRNLNEETPPPHY